MPIPNGCVDVGVVHDRVAGVIQTPDFATHRAAAECRLDSGPYRVHAVLADPVGRLRIVQRFETEHHQLDRLFGRVFDQIADRIEKLIRIIVGFWLAWLSEGTN